VSEHFAGSGFKIFAKMLTQDGVEIRAIPAPGGGSGAFCNKMNDLAIKEGLPGMGFIRWKEEGGNIIGVGPIAKNIGPERTEAIRQQLDLSAGDSAFFLAGIASDFEDIAAKIRNVIGLELNLTKLNKFEFCWIVDFPMYERDKATGNLDFSHNPFSMPQGEMGTLENDNPLDILGYQYDIVCNGVELSSGAIRNHNPEIMYKAFSIVGKDKAFVDANFGGMISAFRFGAPPHGGIAPGIDRMVMLLAGAQNIREVIMFPMNQLGEDLMMGAPNFPTNEAIRDLGIKFLPKA
jgi:aspartyl-tRNA synthetase